MGAHSIKRGYAQGRVLGELLHQPSVRVANSSDTTTHHDAALYACLKTAGTPIPTNDLWISALATEHSLVFYMRNVRFERVPSIPRLHQLTR